MKVGAGQAAGPLGPHPPLRGGPPTSPPNPPGGVGVPLPQSIAPWPGAWRLLSEHPHGSRACSSEALPACPSARTPADWPQPLANPHFPSSKLRADRQLSCPGPHGSGKGHQSPAPWGLSGPGLQGNARGPQTAGPRPLLGLPCRPSPAAQQRGLGRPPPAFLAGRVWGRTSLREGEPPRTSLAPHLPGASGASAWPRSTGVTQKGGCWSGCPSGPRSQQVARPGAQRAGTRAPGHADKRPSLPAPAAPTLRQGLRAGRQDAFRRRWVLAPAAALPSPAEHRPPNLRKESGSPHTPASSPLLRAGTERACGSVPGPAGWGRRRSGR